MIHFAGSCELGEEEETKKVTWKVLCCGYYFEFMSSNGKTIKSIAKHNVMIKIRFARSSYKKS